MTFSVQCTFTHSHLHVTTLAWFVGTATIYSRSNGIPLPIPGAHGMLEIDSSSVNHRPLSVKSSTCSPPLAAAHGGCSTALSRLPDGQLFNSDGVDAFNRAREEALACGLDIKVSTALLAAPVPIYPARRSMRTAAAHHSTHDLERGAIGIDIEKWWMVKDILEKHGFRWRNHPHHPGHFDYLG